MKKLLFFLITMSSSAIFSSTIQTADTKMIREYESNAYSSLFLTKKLVKEASIARAESKKLHEEFYIKKAEVRSIKMTARQVEGFHKLVVRQIIATHKKMASSGMAASGYVSAEAEVFKKLPCSAELAIAEKEAFKAETAAKQAALEASRASAKALKSSARTQICWINIDFLVETDVEQKLLLKKKLEVARKNWETKAAELIEIEGGFQG